MEGQAHKELGCITTIDFRNLTLLAFPSSPKDSNIVGKSAPSPEVHTRALLYLPVVPRQGCWADADT